MEGEGASPRCTTPTMSPTLTPAQLQPDAGQMLAEGRQQGPRGGQTPLQGEKGAGWEPLSARLRPQVPRPRCTSWTGTGSSWWLG